MNKLYIKLTILSLVVVLSSCSFVSLNSQAKDVIVTPNAKALANCKFLGNTNVSLWSKAGTFQSPETVEEQLDTLARNQAASMGGNAVTPNSKISDNARSYGIYNCPINPTN